MGLFGKKTSDGKGLPAPDELHFTFTPAAPQQVGQRPSVSIPSERVARVRSAINYGIDDAIKLVRGLPRQNLDDVIVADIIKQTLASVDVYISDIIEDAGRKENEINEESRRIEEDIAELTSKMEALKQELISLQEQLNETMSVRAFLRKALDQKLNESYDAASAVDAEYDSESDVAHPIEGEHLPGDDDFEIDGRTAPKSRSIDVDPRDTRSAGRADPIQDPEKTPRKSRWDSSSIFGPINKPQQG